MIASGQGKFVLVHVLSYCIRGHSGLYVQKIFLWYGVLYRSKKQQH